MTQAQDYPKAKPVLSSSLRKGVNESQHHVLHKISSSQVTKSSNIWPINTIPQPSRTPRQTHAQKLVKTDTADARKDTHCVHVQATCELIPLRSSSEGGNRWFQKNLPFVWTKSRVVASVPTLDCVAEEIIAEDKHVTF